MHKKIVYDASCLILLNRIDQLDSLQKVFGEVLINNFRISSNLIRKVLESANEN